jgi:hypothetical protein
LAMKSGAAGGAVGTNIFTSLERITMHRPWTTGLDLQEARAAAASSAAEDGMAREATAATIGRRDRRFGNGSTATSVGQAPTCRAEGWERATRGGRIWLRRSKRASGKADQGGGGASTGLIAMVAGPLFRRGKF